MLVQKAHTHNTSFKATEHKVGLCSYNMPVLPSCGDSLYMKTNKMEQFVLLSTNGLFLFCSWKVRGMPSPLCCCSSVQTPRILLLSSEAWLDPYD